MDKTDTQIDTTAIASHIRELIAEPEAFGAWLEAQKSGALVGEVCISSTCPFATFLTDALHKPAVPLAVGTAAISIYRDRNPRSEDWVCDISLPPWARRFIELVDKSQLGGHGITREQALEIYHRVA